LAGLPALENFSFVVVFCGNHQKPHLTRPCASAHDGSHRGDLSSQSRSLEKSMSEFIHRIWSEDTGQDIAEYAVMLAVILVLVVGTIRLIGSNANNAFSSVASSIQ
jgi:Flp pilus assembly pilin Flp